MRTDRLDLAPPQASDAPALYAILGDPRVWTHLPSARHTSLVQTSADVEAWRSDWRRDGLGFWVVRRVGESEVIGYGGCAARADAFWNLGYRFAPASHGQGLATEVALAAIDAARERRPDLPIVAYLLEHNRASARVAERVGLTLRHRAPDAGNPDPTAIRLVYADRALTDPELAATLA